MRTSDFDFELPNELIAQVPTPQRDQSRLLVLHRETGRTEHKQFRELTQFLKHGDVLVLNNSKVIPARLRGTNMATGGKFEILMLEENKINDWWAMLRPGRRARVGTRITLDNLETEIVATVIDTNQEGHRRLRICGVPNILSALDSLGEVPLPPYIRPVPERHEEDRQRYQTVFASTPGSVAAPTAGLHFTGNLLDQLRAQGVEITFVTLHVGLGTFAPVKAESVEAHAMHEERYELDEQTASLINAARQEGRRLIAVGTTALRVLESVASNDPRSLVAAGRGKTRIFIYPPREFRIVDGLLTNFHLPRSTLLMLVSAFAAPGQTRGRELVLAAYAEAIRQRYRFFSYGDAMLIL